MRYEIQPLGPWTRPVREDRHSSGRFKANWQSTLDMLGRETWLLGAELVVLQIDVRAGDVRRDGMLRADARVGHPGVRVSFHSLHGPLTYSSDAYEQRWSGDPPGWQANVRAIALGLEALRAVDRYGITSSGEQYRGWTAIAAGSTPTMTAYEAAELLAEAAGDGTPAREVMSDPRARERAYQAAAKRLHPDVGGDPADFHELTQARDLLVAAAKAGL